MCLWLLLRTGPKQYESSNSSGHRTPPSKSQKIYSWLLLRMGTRVGVAIKPMLRVIAELMLVGSAVSMGITLGALLHLRIGIIRIGVSSLSTI
jgi:hypothetical protein